MAGILTKHGSNSNIRIPPESSGPRVQMQKRIDLEITAPSGFNTDINFWEYPTVQGLSSGATGTIVFYADLNASANKQISVILDTSSVLNFTPAESLLVTESNHTHTVTLLSVQEVLVPANVIVSGKNPLNTIDVSREGALFVTFPEGDQQIDGWGVSKFSQTNIIGIHGYDGIDDTTNSYNQLTASGSVTGNTTSKLLELDVQTGATDAVKKTTNKYHYYNPPGASVAKLPICVGDSGKPNVTRRWGMYDDADGIFWELNQTALRVGIRSSTSGTVVDTYYEQATWNGDRLDGGGGLYNLSGVDLAVDTMNVYWVELPSSNVARYRFGTFGEKGRIICHTVDGSNVNFVPMMARASLPLRWEILNTGVSASPSRLSISGGIVETEGMLIADPVLPATPASAELPNAAVGDSWTHVATFRSGLYLPGGSITNRKRTVPSKFSYYVAGAPIALQVRVGVVMDGTPSFTSINPLSPVEVDTAGTFPSNPLYQGIPVFTRMYAMGVSQEDAPKEFTPHGSNMILRADGNYGVFYTFVARSLTPGTPAAVQFSMDWKDY